MNNLVNNSSGKKNKIYPKPISTKKLNKSKEVILLAKTSQKNVIRIEKTVKKLHSYDTPCILFLEIKYGNKEFLKWITRNT